jgi:hypothetical protein
MDDMHDYCNVSHYLDALGDAQTAYMMGLREFRAARPWLRHNLGHGDHFDYVNPADGAVVFRALRTGPTGEQVFCIAHMEGRPLPEMDPLAMPIPGLGGGGWRVTLTAPGVTPGFDGGPLALGDNTAVIYTRMR